MAMDWSEVAKVEVVWFLVRHTFLPNRIARRSHSSIAINRQMLHAGFGVVFAPDGVVSAKLIKDENGVHECTQRRLLWSSIRGRDGGRI